MHLFFFPTFYWGLKWQDKHVPPYNHFLQSFLWGPAGVSVCSRMQVFVLYVVAKLLKCSICTSPSNTNNYQVKLTSGARQSRITACEDKFHVKLTANTQTTDSSVMSFAWQRITAAKQMTSSILSSWFCKVWIYCTVGKDFYTVFTSYWSNS